MDRTQTLHRGEHLSVDLHLLHLHHLQRLQMVDLVITVEANRLPMDSNLPFPSLSQLHLRSLLPAQLTSCPSRHHPYRLSHPRLSRPNPLNTLPIEQFQISVSFPSCSLLHFPIHHLLLVLYRRRLRELCIVLMHRA